MVSKIYSIMFIPIWGRFPIWQFFLDGLKPPTTSWLSSSSWWICSRITLSFPWVSSMPGGNPKVHLETWGMWGLVGQKQQQFDGWPDGFWWNSRWLNEWIVFFFWMCTLSIFLWRGSLLDDYFNVVLTTGYGICWPCWRIPMKAFCSFSVRP